MSIVNKKMLHKRNFCVNILQHRLMSLSFYYEGEIMSAYCEICHKGKMSGNNVSHSHLKTKRKWKPNIQSVRAIIDGEVKRINVCTKCLRSQKVQRTI